MSVAAAAQARTGGMTKDERFVILASSLGTVFEWYDFYLYGSLATIIGAQFFSAYPPGTRDIFALLAFAAGFLVRPFGAIVFGRVGDIVGRKYTFLVTILIMGLSTFIVGLLPNAATIGFAAPVILIALRLAQGLALGGEYGGAATYVAEHAPHGRRGYYTSFIQTTATLGLFLSLLVILFTRIAVGEAEFAAWGWRIPFLVSVLLLAISVWIRLRLNESPIFQKMKDEGKSSKAPLTEAFANWSNGKFVLLALLGGTMGQGVVWYTGQFYALFYMQTILKVNVKTANIVVAVALLIGMPFFTVVGALSDRIGRKKLMMAGCLLGVLTYIPIYKAMERAAGNNVVTVKSARNKVTGAISLTAMTTDATGAFVPAKEASNPNFTMLVLLVFVQVLYVCLVYGPIAAYLIEAFPAKIRYTSLSLPYHIGNGVFGGLLPLIGLSSVAATGNIYAGLYYPMIVAGMTFIVGSLLLRETKGVRIWDEAGNRAPAVD
jgi:MFS family permease